MSFSFMLSQLIPTIANQVAGMNVMKEAIIYNSVLYGFVSSHNFCLHYNTLITGVGGQLNTLMICGV